MIDRDWYEALRKPDWTPAGSTIGIIWTILYPIIFVSYAIVFYRTIKGTMHWVVLAIFSLNVIGNLLFTPIEFGLQNLLLASLDIIIVWATIVALIIALWPYSRTLALLQVPYLVWVSIATYLQISILLLNK